MMFLLALARGLPYYVEAQRQRRWDKDARPGPALDLTGATALIVGVGGIGAGDGPALSGLRHDASSASIPRWEHEAPASSGARPDELDAVLPRADVVIATTPHTPETEGMWNARRFRLMKPTRLLHQHRARQDDAGWTIWRPPSSAARSPAAASTSSRSSRCRPTTGSGRLPNVLLTPHVAVKDAENLPERRYQVLLENARRFAAGEPLRNVVDKAAWF